MAGYLHQGRRLSRLHYTTRSNRSLEECVRYVCGVYVAVEGEGWMVIAID